MRAEAAAQLARTVALQASGTKARRNRSGASYHLLTLQPLSEPAARAQQEREDFARWRARERSEMLASHQGSSFDILSGGPKRW